MRIIRRGILTNKGLFENYSIDNEGNIYDSKGRKMKPKINANGYATICLGDGHSGRYYFKIHRLVAMNFLPYIDNSLDVNHIDGKKLNNDSTNLEWCTRSQNLKHAYDLGLRKCTFDLSCDKNGNSKYNKEVIKNVIIDLYINKMKVAKISKKYNVKESTVKAIKNKKQWVSYIEFVL